jgi:prepilin-type N-terminal cleavage/methylation domain-containing protein
MIKTMKNNKAFTLVELLIVVIIVAIIGDIVLQFVDSFARLLFYVFMYFVIPAIIFGVALKLNQKYKWVVKKRYASNFFQYKLKNGDIINKEIVQLNVWAFIIAWPIYLPVMLAIIGGKEVYHRYLKNWFNIPEGK